MARFNKTVAPIRRSPVVANLAGGKGFQCDPHTELAGIIFTSWAKPQFYRSFDDANARMMALIDTCGPTYAAKCAHIARRRHGLRSVSHLVMARLSQIQGDSSGIDWPAFYRSMVVRPDDITETLALTQCKTSRAMRRGFALALESFDTYQLAKYAKFGREQAVNLNDAVRLCHPKPTESLTLLLHRELTNTATWEAMGNSAETWRTLLESKRLGYLALLRNLRNIEKTGDRELIRLALDALVDEKAIAKSKVFPFQLMTAYGQVSLTETKAAIESACEESLSNVPVFDGDTVVMLDVSGSMGAYRDTAALFTAVLAKRSNARVVAFDGTAREFRIGSASILKTAVNMPFPGGTTNFSAAYQFLRDNQVNADRLFVITDMQHWVGGDSSYGPFLEWCALTGCDPQVWSIDLAGYGVSQFPNGKCRQLFGFSDKIFDVVPEMEHDAEALVKMIESVEFA